MVHGTQPESCRRTAMKQLDIIFFARSKKLYNIVGTYGYIWGSNVQIEMVMQTKCACERLVFCFGKFCVRPLTAIIHHLAWSLPYSVQQTNAICVLMGYRHTKYLSPLAHRPSPSLICTEYLKYLKYRHRAEACCYLRLQLISRRMQTQLFDKGFFLHIFQQQFQEICEIFVRNTYKI